MVNERCDWNGVASRLDRLEADNRALGRECRRWRRGAGGLLLAGMVLGLAGAGVVDKVARTVEAQSFVLKDTQGKVRASLGFRSDGTPGLALLDEQSHVRLALDLCSNGAPAVNLYDPNGCLQAAVAVRPDGSPGLGMFDDGGRVRLSLDLGAGRSAPGLSLYDRGGAMRAAMAVRPDETPGLGLFDPEGRVVVSIDSENQAPGPRPVPAEDDAKPAGD